MVIHVQPQTRLCTADDLWEISHRPENEAKRFELIDGEIVEMSPTGWIHGKVTMELGRLIANHVAAHGLGEVMAAETGFSLSQDGLNVLAPDVGFIVKARVPSELPESGYVLLAPDLAVEVVSPGNRPRDMLNKVEKYLEHGTNAVWVVYPDERVIDVYHRQPDGVLTLRKVNTDSTLDGGDMLPGFTLKVADIFPAQPS